MVYRMQHNWDWEGPFEVILPKPSAQTRPPIARSSGPHSVSPGRETPQPGWAASGSAQPLSQEKCCFLTFRKNSEFCVSIHKCSPGESILSTPDDFLVLHVLENGFQGYLSYHHPRNPGEVNRPVVFISVNVIDPQ